MGLGDHQTMPFVGGMDVHERQSRLVPIELMTLRGSGSDLAENALRSGHSALPAKVIDRQSITLLRCLGTALCAFAYPTLAKVSIQHGQLPISFFIRLYS